MQIAICDDEKIFRSNLKDILLEYKTAKRLHIDIFEYETGNDLLKSDNVFDIVFIDYQMPNLNGLETARILRSKNSICSIIFATAYPEFILDSFEVQPFRFMIKPLNISKVYEALDGYIKQQKLLHPLIVIEDGEQKTIASKDIIYIEGDGKYCYVRTIDTFVHCSKTVSQVHSQLPEHCFYRTHKSFVVNMYCIKSIKDGNIIVFNNGEKAPISRNKITQFKKAYMSFVKNYFVRM